MASALSQSTPDPFTAIPPVRISTEPVTGEIVSPPQPVSPLRFGLRSLFAIMAVSSVQCALMSYLGVLVGLAVGTAACILAFSGLLCVGMLFSAAGAAQQVQRLDRFVVWLMMAIVTLILGTTLAGGGAIVLTILASARSQAWVQSAVGLTLQPTYVIEGTDPLLSQHVLFVIPGSVAEQAGINRGDIILWDGERSNFAEMLDKNRGKDVELTITTLPLNAAGQPTSKRTVTLAVPK